MCKVKYTDSTENNDIQEYLTKEKAMEEINSELNEVKNILKGETTIMEILGVRQRYGIKTGMSMHVGRS